MIFALFQVPTEWSNATSTYSIWKWGVRNVVVNGEYVKILNKLKISLAIYQYICWYDLQT